MCAGLSDAVAGALERAVVSMRRRAGAGKSMRHTVKSVIFISDRKVRICPVRCASLALRRGLSRSERMRVEVAVGIALPDAVNRPAVGPRTARLPTVSWAGGLVVCGYLTAAVVLNWRLWAGLGAVTPLGDPGQADNDLFAWFMRYVADAVAHGHLPALVTQALNAPRGLNLMWNTSLLFPSLVMAPVTLLGGPQTSLTILLTLGYAASATAMYWLLRQHSASVLAAGLGGAFYGFSPALLDSSIGHYNLQFAVLPPLIVEAVLRIIAGRGRPLAAGACLAVLAAAQLFTEEELLTDIVLACLALTAVLAASRPRMVRTRLGGAAVGLGAGAAAALVICGYALWIQFAGPLTEHGSPYPNAKFGNSLGAFVNPPAGLLLHTTASAAYAVSHRADSGEYLAYLGWPLLILLALATIRYWRDLRVRAAGVTWAVLELLSMGGDGSLLPFHWLQGLPLLVEMLPDRLSILADGAAAAVLAFALDLARASAQRPVGSQRTAGPMHLAGRPLAGPLRSGLPVAIAVLALLPLIPRPVPATPVATAPAGWGTVFTRLHLSPQARVLVVPAPYSHQAVAMRWQADTGQPGELIAGWFIGPNRSGRAVTSPWGPAPATHDAGLCLDALWNGAAADSGCAMVRSALSYWQPAAIVADTHRGTPLAQFLIKLLGEPTLRDGQLLAWRT